MTTRYSRTLLFNSCGEMEEMERNSESASEMVTKVSPASMGTCTKAKRPNG